MTRIYTKPIIFELGNISELTAGGKSNSSEKADQVCYDSNGNILTHIYDQPEK